MEAKYLSLNELFKDSGTAQKLMNSSAEEAVIYLKEQHGLDFTVEELNEVAQGIQVALKEEAADELTSDQLEDVTGGGKGSGAYNAGYYIGKTVKIVGTAAAIGKFAVAVGIISW